MGSERPLVSIIVPTYNVEKYCRQCFDSLLNQTLKEIEIILVDDGSKDSSGSICDEYAFRDNRIKVIHQTNRGLGLSRNSGLEVATGEYVGFVDSDDCVSIQMFKILYENARRFVADISYCKYQKFATDAEISQSRTYENKTECWEGEKAIRQYMLDRVGLPPKEKEDCLFGASVTCGIFSKKMLDSLNARFISERQFIAEDMIFDIDVIPYCEKIVHTGAELYYYRYNPNSLTTVYKGDRFEMNVELYHEMGRRLSKCFRPDEFYDSLSRYLVKVARIAVMQEGNFIKKNGFTVARKNVRKISLSTELQDVLKKYKWQELPLKYRIICFMQKYKLSVAQLILCKANRG